MSFKIFLRLITIFPRYIQRWVFSNVNTLSIATALGIHRSGTLIRQALATSIAVENRPRTIASSSSTSRTIEVSTSSASSEFIFKSSPARRGPADSVLSVLVNSALRNCHCLKVNVSTRNCKYCACKAFLSTFPFEFTGMLSTAKIRLGTI